MLRRAILTGIVILCGVSGCESQPDAKKLAQMQWHKNTAYVKLNCAEQQYQNGQFEEAFRSVYGCITTNPDIPEAHLLLGKLLLEQRQFYGAKAELTKAVELDEKLDSGWYSLGVIAEEDGDYRRAQDCYEKAVMLKSENVDYILANAEILSAQGRKDDAVRLLEGKLTAMPKNVLLRVASADFLWQMGDDQRAIELYKQASLLAGDDYGEQITESLGYCYIFSGKWNEAEKIFTKLSEQCTQQQSRRLYLQIAALCGMNCGGYGTAVNCYNQLSVTERDNPQVWLKLGQAALGIGAAGRAFECGRRVLELQPGLVEAVALIGCAQYVGGNYTAAISDFEKIRADNEYGAFAWLMTARCYERLGKAGKASLAYQKALEINPNDRLGKFLLASDMYRSASGN